MNILLTFFPFLFFFFIFKYVGFKLDLVDYPNQRKIHTNPVLLIGGLIIFFSLSFYFFFFEYATYELNIFIFSLFFLILGFLDDLYDLNHKIRFFFQILIIICYLYYSKILITDLGQIYPNLTLNLGTLSFFITFFLTLAFINAFNFIDGADGVSSGLLLVSILCFLISLFYFDQNNISFILEPLAILLLLFLIVNLDLLKKFGIQKFFLGDSGTYFLGFFYSSLLIYHIQIDSIEPSIALWCNSIIIFDFVTVIIKRLIKRKNPFIFDNTHLHHLLRNNFISDSVIFYSIIISSILLFLIGFFINIFLNHYLSLLVFSVFFLIYLFFNIKLTIIKKI
jgi:UDP-GlcNAc:undecaprenyl-phosphate/decaprenyl-phosphate GlcNAc-1-phosphate transferase